MTKRPGEYELSVSARLLQFPRQCCCCGRANSPAGQYAAESTRVTGVRVVRHDTRSWTFPICSGCEDWIRAVGRIPPPYNGLALWLLVGASIVGLAFACLITLDETSQGRFPLLGFGLGLPAVASAVVFSYLNSTFRQKHDRGRRRLQATAEAIRPSPECHTRPVKYLGWKGSVHTFIFSNSLFHQAFAAANSRKVIR